MYSWQLRDKTVKPGRKRNGNRKKKKGEKKRIVGCKRNCILKCAETSRRKSESRILKEIWSLPKLNMSCGWQLLVIFDALLLFFFCFLTYRVSFIRSLADFLFQTSVSFNPGFWKPVMQPQFIMQESRPWNNWILEPARQLFEFIRELAYLIFYLFGGLLCFGGDAFSMIHAFN